MSELLDRAIAAHGGMPRWEQVQTCTAHLTVTGPLLAMKGVSGLLGQPGGELWFRAATHAQRVTISPFEPTGRRGVFAPDRTAIETDDGHLIEERPNPRAHFTGHTRQTPWDDLDLLYFVGYAGWNYLTTPFLLARPDVTVAEGQPWPEVGQTWRSLRVVFPASIATHSKEQVFYFDDRGLLRRIDYAAEIAGSVPAAHYADEYREFGGIMVPTRRRVFARRPDGRPDRTKLSFAIDLIGEVSFGS
jgi:hypothetical protein